MQLSPWLELKGDANHSHARCMDDLATESVTTRDGACDFDVVAITEGGGILVTTKWPAFTNAFGGGLPK